MLINCMTCNSKSLIICVLFYTILSCKILAQTKDTLLIHNQSLLLASITDSILRSPSDSSRIAYASVFRTTMDSIITSPASFYYSFSSNKNLSVLTSDDRKLRVYTWMLPTQNGMLFEFFGYVQTMNKTTNKISCYVLNEKKYNINNEAEYVKLTDTAWYGALYYKLLHKKYNNKDQYILLGWQGKDVFTTRKIIDCISFSASKIEFGKPVFKTGGKTKSRIIFEYNAQANVSVNYNETMDMIVFDHLSPNDPKPEAKGMFNTYGPDMTYDGLKFRDGFWNLEQNILVKNKYDDAPKDVKLNRDLRMQRKE